MLDLKTCPKCSKLTAIENNVCPYCGNYFEKNLQKSNISPQNIGSSKSIVPIKQIASPISTPHKGSSIGRWVVLILSLISAIFSIFTIPTNKSGLYFFSIFIGVFIISLIILYIIYWIITKLFLNSKYWGFFHWIFAIIGGYIIFSIILGVIAVFLTGMVSEGNQNSQITKSFKYTLHGNSDILNVTMDSAVLNTISSESGPAICYKNNNDPTPLTNEETRQCILGYIDEPNEKKYLDDMVSSIQQKTSIPDDQVRIAVSLVQNIPYDETELATLKSSKSTRQWYPYEVLYYNGGVCEEKSLLLAYLLRGLGYGVVLYDYPDIHHLAVGIKAPAYADYTPGYAFIESTNPIIITDSQENYDFGKLTKPTVYAISDGNSFLSVEKEYDDALALQYLHRTDYDK